MNSADAETQIETLFADWYAAAGRKDLDAAMAPIADTIVSYEHSTPLEVRTIGALREECRIGFDNASPQFRWDIPDLKIIIRGDIAVTWGLNRMVNYEDGAVKSEIWSRGTRIFQHIEGSWKMIHQHVSFPFDRESGMARVDLKPETPTGYVT